jgi:primosomal protein N' (replication factor Y)
MMNNLKRGARVIVPFQNRVSLAYVWELTDQSEFSSLKEIRQLIDDPPLISSYHYQLINWMAEFYFCNRVDVIKLCLPPGANHMQKNTYQLAVEPKRLQQLLAAASFPEGDIGRTTELIQAGLAAGWSPEKWQRKFLELAPIGEFLIKNRLLQRVSSLAKPKISPKSYKIYVWNSAESGDKTAAGNRVREILRHSSGLTLPELTKTAGVSASVIQRLWKQGKIYSIEKNEIRTPIGFEQTAVAAEISFNQEQQTIHDTINNEPAGKPFLLHGVTGSGKTEIYFEMAAQKLKAGFQVLYLVPEIALTPQTLQRARGRFGEQVALLHSNMSDGERYDQWFKIKNALANFVLGARSALFAPFERLGLIIIDEEHESTYKQEETPRYHALQVAQKLAQISGAKVILGSATPSVESFYRARTGRYVYLQLKERFNRNPLPGVTIVNMREELQRGNKNILSVQLDDLIRACVTNQEQVILLLNRRGYATFVLCRDCGLSLKCPSCDVSLVYHIHEVNLRCHYCDYRQRVPDICPNCSSTRIRYFGHGTQRLEEELASHFPGARLLRMDLDSTSKKGAHHYIYQQLNDGSVDILLGTQMIAKGLDLPRVTLVGVISADSTLNFPDFRAAERTFSLLTQVAGRAGRGSKPGKVIFQTYNPEHYSLHFAKNHDYLSFYEQEILHRQELGYPPFSELVKFGLSGLKAGQVSSAALKLGEILKTRAADLPIHKNDAGPQSNSILEILGPAPSLIPKIQDKYRWQILVKSNRQLWLVWLVQAVWEQFPFRDYIDVRITRDRNPYSTI